MLAYQQDLDKYVGRSSAGIWQDLVSMGAWTAFTPTFANLTVGNGTLTAEYVRSGRTITFYIRFIFGNTSSMGTSPTYTLPVTAAARYSNNGCDTYGRVILLDSGTANFDGISLAITTGTGNLLSLDSSGASLKAAGVSATSPMTWTTSDGFTVTGTYEAAA